MPFDGATPKRTSEQQANLLELIHDLRNLPGDWEWNYSYSCCCALGRVYALHGVPPNYDWYVSSTGKILGLTFDELQQAFVAAGNFYGKLAKQITPHDVADILEAYL